MASYLWRKFADYRYTKWERTLLWDMVEPYRRPKSFTPLVTIYVAAFYTGVIGAAITEQLYKGLFLQFLSSFAHDIVVFTFLRAVYIHIVESEKYWEDHPGEAVPLMKPTFYKGPWRVIRGEALPPDNLD